MQGAVAEWIGAPGGFCDIFFLSPTRQTLKCGFRCWLPVGNNVGFAQRYSAHVWAQQRCAKFKEDPVEHEHAAVRASMLRHFLSELGAC